MSIFCTRESPNRPLWLKLTVLSVLQNHKAIKWIIQNWYPLGAKSSQILSELVESGLVGSGAGAVLLSVRGVLLIWIIAERG